MIKGAFTLYLFGTSSIIEEAEHEDRGKVFLPAAPLLSEYEGQRLLPRLSEVAPLR